MPMMLGNLYRALVQAKVPADLAQKVAEEAGSFDARLRRIGSDLAVLKWMSGLALISIAVVFLKT